jgi:hypothetical protein
MKLAWLSPIVSVFFPEFEMEVKSLNPFSNKHRPFRVDVVALLCLDIPKDRSLIFGRTDTQETRRI